MLGSEQLFWRWPSSSSLQKKRRRKSCLLNSVQCFLLLVFGVFFPQFFSPITSSPSIDRLLIYTSIMKRSWGLESKPGKGWTVFDRLLNSAGFAPEVDGYKGTEPALSWMYSDFPLNTEEGSPWPRWLEGMQRALAHANEGDFIRFSETEHKSILFCRSLGLPHFFPWGTSSIHVLWGRTLQGRGDGCALGFHLNMQLSENWILFFQGPNRASQNQRLSSLRNPAWGASTNQESS